MPAFFISHAKKNPGKSLTKGSGFRNDLLKSMVWDQGWEKCSWFFCFVDPDVFHNDLLKRRAAHSLSLKQSMFVFERAPFYKIINGVLAGAPSL